MKLPEHRAAARVAWRNARRAKGRTALVLTLVALPIMALAGAGFVLKTAMASPEDRATDTLGSADLQLNSYNQDLTVERVRRVLPAGTIVSNARFHDVERTIRGTIKYMRFEEHLLGPGRPPVVARYALLRGRWPVAPGETTLHPEMLKLLGVQIGQDVEVPELDLRLRVVGVAIQREGLRNLTALLAPGTLPPNADPDPVLDWLIDLPSGASLSAAIETVGRAGITGIGMNEGADVMTRASVIAQRRRELQAMTGGSFAGAVGALFGTGLITAAAFGVGARRQLRTLGLMGAAGAEPRHVRATVLWGGTVLGAFGSVVGVVAGIGLAFAAKPHMSRFVPRVIDTVRLPWLIIAGALAMGTLAATLAAIGPARRAARMTTVDALAGRIPAPKPPGRVAARGLVAVVAGSVLMGVATATRQEKVLGAALVITLAGFLFAIPLLVSWVGHLPTRLPTSLRLAARQTARYGRRTGAAVAAATLALTAPVAIAAYSLSEEAYNARFVALRSDQASIRWNANLVQAYASASAEPLSPEALAAARRSIPGSIGGLIAPALFPTKGPLKHPDQAVIDGPPTLAGVFYSGGSVMIGDANVLRAAHGEKALPAFERGSVVALGPRIDNGEVQIRSGESPEGRGGIIKLPAVAVAVSDEQAYGEDIPRFLISKTTAVRAGLRIGVATSALLRAPHDLSKEEIRNVKAAVSPFSGVSATVRGDLMFPSTAARLLVTGAAALVALIIVGVAMALIGAETRRDRAMFVAVGAGPRMRRKTSAANASMVAALAGLLALPAGFLPAVIVQTTRHANHPIVIPWAIMGIVAIGAPLIAAAIAAMTSREPSPRSLLQPIW